MGFYGNIKNTTRTQFSFDKTYGSRAEMDNQAGVDGVYAGRYVLVEYDKNVIPTNFPIGYLKDGIVYKTLPSRLGGITLQYRLSNFIVTDEETGEGYWEPTQNNIVSPGTIVYIPVEYNFDKIYYEYGRDEKDPYRPIGPDNVTPRGIFLTITNQSSVQVVPMYKYYDDTKVLYTVVDAEGEVVTHEVQYALTIPFDPDNVKYTGVTEFPLEDGKTTAPTMDSYSNYIFNYNVDRSQYGVSRGYDSTVWQKVYEGAAAKYVMVAELNSVVPTFDIEADAPSQVPILPHFDADSTNVYYKLHWQPQWGFRIKGSNPDQVTPELFTSGESRSDRYIPARNDKREYPSDYTTTWVNHIYNSHSGISTKKVFVTDDGNGVPYWMTPEDAELYKNSEVPAAIYFNKAGFDPENISYSWDKEYRDWNTTENTEKKYLVTDEISISPTGQSGHLYNTHGTKFLQERVPDTQELSVMLPSIGDTIAQVWDLVYGGRNLDPDAKTRSTDTKWYNAKAVSNKKGVRLIKSLAPGQYTYNPGEASTLAGILNSTQDLMGMIITDEMPEDPSTANGDYIYFDHNTKKYYFKHKTYKFTEKNFENNRIPDNYNPYEPISLNDWDNKYFYVDTATTSAYEFIKENKFYSDRKYIEDGHVIAAMTPVELTEEYSPNGNFYCRYGDKYPPVEGSVGSSYEYFTASYEEYDDTKDYFVLTPSKEQLGENDAIYTPNTYYYITYSTVLLTDVTYEPKTYYFVDYVDNLGVTHYKLAEGETIEDNYDFEGQKVVNYFKRTYTLDTNLRKGNWVYYRVSPEAGVTSNAYYKENKKAIPATGLKYEDYSAGTYYYKVPSDKIPEGVISELINTTVYVQDITIYESEAEFLEAGKEYFTIEKEYELIQGKDVIDINDENAIKIDNMRDINDFKAGSIEIGAGRDIFYTYVDAQNALRYIEVNYNNYSKAYNAATQKYDFVVMDYSLIGTPYHENTYYYKVEEENEKKGSFLIDESKKITPNRTYYIFTPTEGIDYSGELLEGYYSANDYYIESPPGTGNYIVSTEPFDPNKEYLDPSLQLYVYSDSEGIYEQGAYWPLEIKQIPESIQLATREDVWEFAEIPSFADKITTLHGMLLKLHNYLNEDDHLTRSTLTARGSINLFNDLINRFSALIPGRFVVVDEYGRMHSVQHSTAQPLTFNSLTVNKEEERALEAKENALITVDIDTNFRNPFLTFVHSDANVISDTNSSFNMNSNNSDSIIIETPLYDNAGHIVGKNNHSVTLSYGFKHFTPENSTSTTSQLTGNTTTISATSTQDTLTASSVNKWIKIEGDNKKLKFSHTLVSSNFGGTKSNSQEKTPKFGDTFNIPVITVDNAGHLTAYSTETVKIPGLVFTNDNGTTNDVVLNMSYSYDETKDVGTFVEARGHADNLLIQDYNITGVSSAKLAKTDTIHGAFEKLQAQINAMDLSKVGGGAGEYISDITVVDGIVTANKGTLPTVADNAVNGEFVTSVSESLGKISVNRTAFVPTVTYKDGTENDMPSITIDINGKTSSPANFSSATTTRYGVTKLTNVYNGDNSTLALTGSALKTVIGSLSVSGASGISAAKTIASWKEVDGKVEITTQDIKITNSNIANNAKIAISKIDGLQTALNSKQATIPDNTYDIYGSSAAVLGADTDDSTAMTIYGLKSYILTLEERIEELEKTLSQPTE